MNRNAAHSLRTSTRFHHTSPRVARNELPWVTSHKKASSLSSLAGRGKGEGNPGFPNLKSQICNRPPKPASITLMAAKRQSFQTLLEGELIPRLSAITHIGGIISTLIR